MSTAELPDTPAGVCPIRESRAPRPKTRRRRCCRQPCRMGHRWQKRTRTPVRTTERLRYGSGDSRRGYFGQVGLRTEVVDIAHRAHPSRCGHECTSSGSLLAQPSAHQSRIEHPPGCLAKSTRRRAKHKHCGIEGLVLRSVGSCRECQHTQSRCEVSGRADSKIRGGQCPATFQLHGVSRHV